MVVFVKALVLVYKPPLMIETLNRALQMTGNILKRMHGEISNTVVLLLPFSREKSILLR